MLSQRRGRDFHLRNFEDLLGRVEGFTQVCHTSFVQPYRKTARRLARLAETAGDPFIEPEEGEGTALARELAAMAAARGIELVSCCDPRLDAAGLSRGRCVDPELIAGLRPDLEELSLPGGPTRPGCACAASRDIGAYDTCPAGCLYCYATGSPERVAALREARDPGSPLLDGLRGE